MNALDTGKMSLSDEHLDKFGTDLIAGYIHRQDYFAVATWLRNARGAMDCENDAGLDILISLEGRVSQFQISLLMTCIKVNEGIVTSMILDPENEIYKIAKGEREIQGFLTFLAEGYGNTPVDWVKSTGYEG